MLVNSARTGRTLFARHKRTFLAVLFVFLYSASISLATPPSTKYQPGETLNPDCAPGENNCSVQILPEQTGNADKFLTSDGNQTAWSTNTLILGGNFGTTGGSITLNASGVTNLTLPTSGTLINVADAHAYADSAAASSTNAAVNGTANYIPKFGSAHAVINSNIYDTGANIGINTTTPNSKLEVNGDIRLTAGSGAQIVFADGSTMSSAGAGSAASIGAAGDAIVTGDGDANGSGDVILKTGSNDRFHILNNGNVGVGTATPSALFSVGSGSPFTVTNLGAVTGLSFVKTGGTSAQFLKADGSVDANTYLTTGTASSTYVPVTRTVNGHALSSNVTVTPTDLSLVIGTDVQAYDADLTTYAGITPSANVQTLLGAANYAAFKASLSLNNVENTALSTWAGTTNLTTVGAVTGTSFTKSGGTSSQFLKADGSVDSSTYLTTGNAATGYIQNGTGQQASSNFNISGNGTVGGILTVTGRTNHTDTIAIGSGASANFSLLINKAATGGTALRGIFINSAIQSDVTSSYSTFELNNATQAAAFTLGTFNGFNVNWNTVGAGSAVTEMNGVVVQSSFTGATSTYGFRGKMTAGTGKWNTYMDGTALNYMNGNLQLGSTTATAGAEKLQVSGTASVSSTLLVGGNINLGAYGIGLVSPNGASLKFESGTGNMLVETANESAAFLVNTNALAVTSAGLVGIGTAAPTTNLQVNSSGTNGIIKITNSSSGALVGDGLSITTLDTTGAQLWNYENGYMRFATNNQERLRIDATGNVGIGTASPGTLDAAQFGTSHKYLNVTGTGSQYGVIEVDSALASDADRIGALAFGATAQDASHKYVANILTTLDGATAGQRGGKLEFWTKLNGSTAFAPRMVINNSGNVGIGTASPGSKLHVVGSTGTDISNIQAGAGIFVSGGGSTGIAMGSDGNVNRPVIQGVGSGAALNLLLNPYGANVGVGTTNPIYQFEIASPSNPAVNMVVTGTARAEIGLRDTGAGSNLKHIGIRGDGGQFQFIGWTDAEDNTSTPAMVINAGYGANGNVGIGTSAPGRQLTLYNSSTPILQFTNSTTGTTNIDGPVIYGSGSDLYIQNQESAGGIVMSSNSTSINTNGGATLSFDVNVTRGRFYQALYVDGNFQSLTIGAGIAADGAYPIRLKAQSGDILEQFYSSNGSYSGRTYMDGSSGAYVLQIGGGTTYVPQGGNSWVTGSDRTIKKDVSLIEGSLEKIDSLNGYYFKYLNDGDDDTMRVGVIAQEVQSVLPEAVNKTFSKEYNREILGVSYTDLVPLLINGIKEMNIKVQSLPDFEDPTLAEKVATFLEGIAQGIANIGKVQTKELCIERPDGSSVCIDSDKLDSLLAGENSSGGDSGTPPADPETPPEEEPSGDGEDITPPEETPESPAEETPPPGDEVTP